MRVKLYAETARFVTVLGIVVGIAFGVVFLYGMNTTEIYTVGLMLSDPDPNFIDDMKQCGSDGKDTVRDCRMTAEEYRLKRDDLLQQARSANASEVVAKTSVTQATTNIIQTIAAIFTLLAAIGAAWFARAAARETQRGAIAAEKSSIASEAALSHSKQITEKQLRAYLVVQNVIITELSDNYLRISFDIKNLGTTPARIKVVKASAYTPVIDWKRNEIQVKEPEIVALIKEFLGNTEKCTAQVLNLRSEVPNLNATGRDFFFIGHIRYQDYFDNHYLLDFSYTSTGTKIREKDELVSPSFGNGEKLLEKRSQPAE